MPSSFFLWNRMRTSRLAVNGPKWPETTETIYMKKKSTSQSAFFSLRILISLVAILSGVFLALFATSAQVKRPERAVNLKSPLGGVQEEWIGLYNGGNGFDVAYATALDGSGNAYVT